MNNYKKIYSDKFECLIDGSSSDFFNFKHQNGTSVKLGNFSCNTFSEDGALLDSLKLHNSVDGFYASAELARTIPFGSEFKIMRRMEFADGFCRIIEDINPGIGAVEQLNLEDVVFTGKFTRLSGYFFNAAKQLEYKEIPLNSGAESTLYQSDFPILACQVTTADGDGFEIGCGNDLWRHFAQIEHNQSQFAILGNTEKITFKRSILNFEKEFAIKKRSWRFKYYIAFFEHDRKIGNGGKLIDVSENFDHDANDFNLGNLPCLSAPAVRRKLRKLVRKFNAALTIKSSVAICENAAHLERPNQKILLHWCIEDFFELALWGNKFLAPEHSLVFAPLNPADFMANLIALKAVGKVLTHNLNIEE